MYNDISLSCEYQKLLNQIDALAIIPQYHDDYYLLQQLINFEKAFLSTKYQNEDYQIDIKPKLNTLSVHTPYQTMTELLRNLNERYASNANSADNLETIIYSNINNYAFKSMGIRIKARMDFFDLYFEIRKEVSRHEIKKFLTEKTKIRHYIKECGKGFVIRLHDINSIHQINKRLGFLNHFGLVKESLKITEIEVALDFYCYKHLALITAILKSLKLPNNAENLRIFKTQTGVFTPIPSDPIILSNKIENGFNIGINHKLADEYWHLYRKQTDHNGQPLPEVEWRIRAEKNLKVNVLSKMDNRLVNIKRILLDCFKGIRFTQLKKNTSLKTKQLYADTVDIFGIENEAYINANRNYRKLPEDIEMNSELNKLAVNAICNLAKKFSHPS